MNKTGTSPIVHGTRVLVLEYRLAAIGTVGRLAPLASLGTLERDMLKNALAIVRQFKQHLRCRHHIGA